MKQWHEGFGYIKYDPYRPGLKNKKDWWAIVKVDREITRYYRWWIMKENWVALCQPSWDAHISIVRSERPREDLMHLWKKYDGQKVKFKYEHDVKKVGNYWVLEVDCPKLIEIRKEFKLPCDWKMHLTIGRIW